jgi:hypothetical protein
MKTLKYDLKVREVYTRSLMKTPPLAGEEENKDTALECDVWPPFWLGLQGVG